MFEQKYSAIENFVNNKSENVQRIEDAKKLGWLLNWIKVCGTAAEGDFLKTIDQNEYDSFKTFMTNFYKTNFIDYPQEA